MPCILVVHRFLQIFALEKCNIQVKRCKCADVEFKTRNPEAKLDLDGSELSLEYLLPCVYEFSYMKNGNNFCGRLPKRPMHVKFRPDEALRILWWCHQVDSTLHSQ